MDLKELQDRKFTYVFHWFDQNGDGFVTPEDMKKISDVFTAVADKDDEENMNLIKDGFRHWQDIMQTVREDKTNDKIGKQEFIRIMHTFVISPENLEIAISQIVNGLLGALDTDHNGSLSLEEYVKMYDALGIAPTDSSEAFKRLDRDGSGEITYDELKLAIREYYFSADPNAPGNWLLGPMEI